MPIFDTNVEPDVTGRVLGAVDRRYDCNFRNVNITGTLTGIGTGQQLLSNNVTIGQASVDVQSNTGTGGLRRRFRIKNDAGQAKAVTEFQSSIINLGSEQAALGGVAPINMYSALGDEGQAFITFYRTGSTATPASIITAWGAFRFYPPPVFSAAFEIYNIGDTQSVFYIGPAGQHQWGPGGSAALDVGIDRAGINSLRINNGGAGYGSLDVNAINFKAASGVAPFTVLSTTKVVGLNADLLDGADFGSPNPIGATVPSTGLFTTLGASGAITSTLATGAAPLVVASTTPVLNLTVKRVDSPTFIGVIPGDSPAKKHHRSAIASLAAGARVTITWVFPTPFASGNYSVTANVFDSGNVGGLGLRVERQIGQSTTQCQFQIVNDDTVAAHSGTLHMQLELEV